MLSDRRATRGLNLVCGGLALGLIGTIGVIVWERRRAEDELRDLKPPALPPAQEAFRRVRRGALGAEEIGDFPTAEERYRKALALAPSVWEVRTGLARTLVAEGKRSEAWTLYRSLAKEKTMMRDIDAMVWSADLAREFGTPAESERVMRGFIEVFGWQPQWKGKELLVMAHLSGALDALPWGAALQHAKRAARLEPGSVMAKLRIASIRVAKNGFADPDASAQIDAAKRIASKGTTKDRIRIAGFYAEHDQGEEAWTTLQEAAARIPANDASGWLAASDLARSLFRSPLNFDSRSKRGKGADLLASAGLARALRTVRPDDAKTLEDLAERLDDKKDAVQRKVLVEAARRAVSPSEGFLCYRIGASLVKLGEKAEAKALIKEAIRHDGGTNRVLLERDLAGLEGRHVTIPSSVSLVTESPGINRSEPDIPITSNSMRRTP